MKFDIPYISVKTAEKNTLTAVIPTVFRQNSPEFSSMMKGTTVSVIYNPNLG